MKFSLEDIRGRLVESRFWTFVKWSSPPLVLLVSVSFSSLS
jgi:hypothetical protein